MRRLEGIAEDLLSGLSALPEKSMRLGLFARTLAALPPEDAANLIEIIYGMDPRDTGASIVRAMMVDHDALGCALGRTAYDSIYLAAIRLNLSRVERLFNDIEPLRGGVSGYEEEEFVKTEHLSLGERRSLSKSHRYKDIERLLSDPDPIIVTNLLNNPRITEREVLKIASRRPNSPHVLKLVALHGKWSGRYEVLKAVSRNPYAFPRVSMALIEGLLAQDLEEIAEDNTLHPELKLAARDLLDKKRRLIKGNH
ncbi:MAG: hypothetical protein HS130_12010 [Deltaproteobacteria bacterium]|nr:hypothetical protein [Deltaproteobacteria bacterium]MCL4873653.1 hypothetical protein [bacterium]